VTRISILLLTGCSLYQGAVDTAPDAGASTTDAAPTERSVTMSSLSFQGLDNGITRAPGGWSRPRVTATANDWLMAEVPLALGATLDDCTIYINDVAGITTVMVGDYAVEQDTAELLAQVPVVAGVGGQSVTFNVDYPHVTARGHVDVIYVDLGEDGDALHGAVCEYH
jgi:hypothetical protein